MSYESPAKLHPYIRLSAAGADDGALFAVAIAAVVLTVGMHTVAIVNRLVRSTTYDATTWGYWLPWVVGGLGLAVTVAGGAVWRTRTVRKRRQRRRLETPATGEKYRSVLQSIARLSAAAWLTPPKIECDIAEAGPANARVRQDAKQSTIVINRPLLRASRRNEDAAEAILAHEIGHLELNDIGRFEWARYVNAGLLAVLLVAGAADIALYLHARFAMHWLDPWLAVSVRILTGASAAIVVLAAIRYSMIRRELLHDLRAAELSTAHALRSAVDQAEAKRRSRGLLSFIRSFTTYHPTEAERRRNAVQLEPARLDTIIYPVAVGFFLVTVPITMELITSGLRGAGVLSPVELWTSLVTRVLYIVVVFVLLGPDIARVAMLLIKRQRSVFAALIYVIMIQVGAAIAAGSLLLLNALHEGSPPATSSMVHLIGGMGWSALSYLGLFALTGYCWAIIASSGHVGARQGAAELLRIGSGLAFISLFELLRNARGFNWNQLWIWLATCVGLAIAVAGVNLLIGLPEPRRPLTALRLRGDGMTKPTALLKGMRLAAFGSVALLVCFFLFREVQLATIDRCEIALAVKVQAAGLAQRSDSLDRNLEGIVEEAVRASAVFYGIREESAGQLVAAAEDRCDQNGLRFVAVLEELEHRDQSDGAPTFSVIVDAIRSLPPLPRGEPSGVAGLIGDHPSKKSARGLGEQTSRQSRVPMTWPKARSWLRI